MERAQGIKPKKRSPLRNLSVAVATKLRENMKMDTDPAIFSNKTNEFALSDKDRSLRLEYHLHRIHLTSYPKCYDEAKSDVERELKRRIESLQAVR